jgi:DNA repair protein RadC
MTNTNQFDHKSIPAKRVNIVSVKLCRESSLLYKPRYISTPKDAAVLVKDFLAFSDREVVVAVYLDTKNQPTAISTISVGTLNSSLVHPREVFKGAVLSNAAGMVIAHNHPSGVPEPSQDDIAITKRLDEAGKIMGIGLIDHVIIGGEGQWVSLREMGLL